MISWPNRYATSPCTLCRFVENDRSLTCTDRNFGVSGVFLES